MAVERLAWLYRIAVSTNDHFDSAPIASGNRTLLDLIPQCIAFRFETVLVQFGADGRHWLNDAEDF